VNHESEFRIFLQKSLCRTARRKTLVGSKFNPEFALGSFTCRDEQMPFEFRWRIPLGPAFGDICRD